MIGPIILYAHEDPDEGDPFLLEALKEQGATDAQLDVASNFLRTKPLYEITFEFYLDEDGTDYCTKVDLGDGKPFTRACPGQLRLFDQETQ